MYNYKSPTNINHYSILFVRTKRVGDCKSEIIKGVPTYGGGGVRGGAVV